MIRNLVTKVAAAFLVLLSSSAFAAELSVNTIFLVASNEGYTESEISEIAQDAEVTQAIKTSFWFDGDGERVKDGNGMCVRNLLYSSNSSVECYQPAQVEVVSEQAPAVSVKPKKPKRPKKSKTPTKTKKPAPKIETLDATIYFDYDSNALRVEQQAKLERMVAKADKFKQIIKVTVDGYTDSKGAEDYNYELSQARINTVVNYLELRGVDVQSTTAWGENKLVLNADGSENLPKSRRATVDMKVK